MKDSRIPLLLGMLVLAVAGVIVAVVGLPDFERPAGRPIPKVADAPAASPPEATQRPGDPVVEPQLETRPVPEAPLVVDSFPPTRHVPLDRWVTTSTVAGHFDGLSLLAGGQRAGIVASQPLDGNTTLLAAGWAGDSQLGLQLPDVLISQCGRIVARARTVLERPDVADAVHPNLARSGWEALLHTSDLAICAEPSLRAWAVLAGRPPALLPLNGVHRLGVIEPVSEPAYHVAALPPLEPDDVEPPLVREIEVTAARVNLRRCGTTDCAKVAQIESGRHRVHIAGRRADWSLLVFRDRAGWMSDKFYKPAP